MAWGLHLARAGAGVELQRELGLGQVVGSRAPMPARLRPPLRGVHPAWGLGRLGEGGRAPRDVGCGECEQLCAL